MSQLCKCSAVQCRGMHVHVRSRFPGHWPSIHPEHLDLDGFEHFKFEVEVHFATMNWKLTAPIGSRGRNRCDIQTSAQTSASMQCDAIRICGPHWGTYCVVRTVWSRDNTSTGLLQNWWSSRVKDGFTHCSHCGMRAHQMMRCNPSS